MTKKVCVILANNCEEGEVAEIIDVMRRAKFETVGVSIEGEIVTGQHGVRIVADAVMGEDV